MSETKKCPFCAEEINAAAIKCRFCGSSLNSAPEPAPEAQSAKKPEPAPEVQPAKQPEPTPATPAEEAKSEARKCPFCAEEISAEAIKCRFCGSSLNSAPAAAPTAAAGQSQQSNLELYTPNAAGLWCLCFSVIFGSWCIWQNYKTLKNEKAAKRSMYITIGLSVAILLLIFFPIGAASTINMILLIAWYFVEQRPQAKFLENNHIAFKKKSWLKPIIVAVIATVILLCVNSCVTNANNVERTVVNLTSQILAEHGRGSLECVKITKVKSIGDDEYSAKAVLRNTRNNKTKFMDITYEEVDDSVVVYIDMNTAT